ncbi:unnamed protein product, partial [Brassica oleracea]
MFRVWTTYISVVYENPTVVVFRRYLRRRRKTLNILVLILLFPSICRSVTAWDHIFSDHIFLDNIFSNCKSFVFC